MRRIAVAGEPVLRQKARGVNRFDPSLANLVRDLVDTMRAAPGIGLAAPQIGVSLRVFVAEISPEDERAVDELDQTGKLYVLCNPQIVKAWGEVEGTEGCLSIPGYVGEVKRAEVVLVRGQNLKGKPMRVKVRGLLARIFQHEIDHLDGILFTDRLESLDKLRKLEQPSPPEESVPRPVAAAI